MESLRGGADDDCGQEFVREIVREFVREIVREIKSPNVR
jgi:hypothetical protein